MTKISDPKSYRSLAQTKASIEAVDGILWTANARGEVTVEQEGWGRFTGQTFDEYQRFGWMKAVHLADTGQTIRSWERAVADACPFLIEYRLRRHDGVWRQFTARAIPLLDPDGNTLEWVCVNVDVTDERAMKAQLSRTAEHLSLALDAGQTGTWEIDLQTGHNTWDDRLFGLWGIEGPIAPSLDAIFAIIHKDDREKVRLEFGQLQTAAGTGLFEVEYRIKRASDGEERWLFSRGKPTGTTVPFTTLLGATRDVTDRKKRDQQIQFLMGELNHRTKNILAVVQAIARQTARGAESVEAFGEAFAQRISAMSGSLDLLIKQNWSSASLLELVRIQTSPTMGENGDRIRLTGEDLALLPDAAQNLGLALHELSTNAAKYGALSVPGGHIALGWWITEGVGAEKTFSLVWKELGGPPVTAPTRKGFGDTVMNRLVKAALSGSALLEYEPDGVKWSVNVPVSQILQGNLSGV